MEGLIQCFRDRNAKSLENICWRGPIGLSLSCMSRFSFLVCPLVATAILFCAVVKTSAQTEARSGTEGQGVVLAKLFPPLYPPIAKTARVIGDVVLMVGIRQDGSIESAVTVSGHPLLTQAALDSVQHSQFECRSCGKTVTSYQLVYSFELGPTEYCGTTSSPDDNEAEQHYPQVIQSRNHITLVDRPIGTCDMAFQTSRRVRSAKCLYLWRCGLR